MPHFMIFLRHLIHGLALPNIHFSTEKKTICMTENNVYPHVYIAKIISIHMYKWKS